MAKSTQIISRTNDLLRTVRSLGIAAAGFGIIAANVASAEIIETYEDPRITQSSAKSTEVNEDQLLESITGTSDELSSLPKSDNANPSTQFLAKDADEKFVFINFSARTKDDLFNKIVLSNGNGATVFDSDNRTFSAGIQVDLPGISAVPEPKSIALLGIGVVCLILHARFSLRQDTAHSEKS
jgi:hypothetical protein